MVDHRMHLHACGLEVVARGAQLIQRFADAEGEVIQPRRLRVRVRPVRAHLQQRQIVVVAERVKRHRHLLVPRRQLHPQHPAVKRLRALAVAHLDHRMPQLSHPHRTAPSAPAIGLGGPVKASIAIPRRAPRAGFAS